MMFENTQGVQQEPPRRTARDLSAERKDDELLVEASGLSRSYLTGAGGNFFALRDADLRIAGASLVALVGSSGSGKSTLLNLIAGLDRPTAGRLFVTGMDLTGKSEDELSRHRGRSVGVVFQFFQLLPTLTVLENVLLPMQLTGAVPTKDRQEHALGLLERFGIADQAPKLPTMLSGGQQQRVAIARALANDPPLLVADEPTGNLDSRTAERVFELLSGLPQAGTSVILATHETRFLPYFDRVITLADGRIAGDESQGARAPVFSPGAASC